MGAPGVETLVARRPGGPGLSSRPPNRNFTGAT